MADSIRSTVRQILGDYARLAIDIDRLSDHDDLYDAGMTSHATVNVMLALEEAFDIEFPEEALRRGTFESVMAIERTVNEVRAEAA